MKTSVLAGIVLIVLGLTAFLYQGVSVVVDEKVVDVGPLEIEKEEEKTIPLPPVLGAVALAGGLVLVIRGTRGSART
ncbi:MAG: DUF3185 domain-containing protein [Bacteroidetes bacterium]|nr:DUF3185 domain-containing protein [Rhodothermaceae bacterium RA]RMH65233.1 MAG: DUF3185 domain-containing protein [Bacteroidota bacterium]